LDVNLHTEHDLVILLVTVRTDINPAQMSYKGKCHFRYASHLSAFFLYLLLFLLAGASARDNVCSIFYVSFRSLS